MARIRYIQIRNFRSLKSFDWAPGPGLNCLIGPGDSGKSTVLDAIDACLSPRRTINFADTDFYGLDVTKPIEITVTLGELPDELKDLDLYGDYLRGFDDVVDVMDEPHQGVETVLSVQLKVGPDLEATWRLYSDRTSDEDSPKSLPWSARSQIGPTRLGGHPSSNLSWARGSVLNRLTEDRLDLGAELVKAARDARASFGDAAAVPLKATLNTVTTTAKELGIVVGDQAKALLDAHAVSFAEGAVSLHTAAGIPLRSLGTGSNRLLLAGLHRAAAQRASIILADEVEFGLEPHRLIRLLHSLGSKEKQSPLQVFMTTHSPVVVRELSGMQLHVLRDIGGRHRAFKVGDDDDIQASVRCDPEAFLAHTVYVCEGASEIGLIRGLDLCFTAVDPKSSLQAKGAAFVNAAGGNPDLCLKRAQAIRKLGYRTVAFIDNDKPPTQADVDAFLKLEGILITWPPDLALEDVLFKTFPVQTIGQLIGRGVELAGIETVNQTLTKVAGKPTRIEDIGQEPLTLFDYSADTRTLLGRASRVRKQGWFKSLGKMEGVAREILGPQWTSSAEFKSVVERLWNAAG